VAKTIAEFGATGRRKTASAHVRIKAGEGKVSVNARAFEDYFPVEMQRTFIQQPLKAIDGLGKFDLVVSVTGGGPMGQAGAMRHGIARALLLVDAGYREKLKKGGFLTRDSRMKERLKPGQPGERKRFQFSKR
jgi:small subunit ribosomal protein S9